MRFVQAIERSPGISSWYLGLPAEGFMEIQSPMFDLNVVLLLVGISRAQCNECFGLAV
jgi:hypothetical protein